MLTPEEQSNIRKDRYLLFALWLIRGVGASFVYVGYSAINSGFQMVNESRDQYETAINPGTMSGFLVSVAGALTIYSTTRIVYRTIDFDFTPEALEDNEDFADTEENAEASELTINPSFPLRDIPRQQS